MLPDGIHHGHAHVNGQHGVVRSLFQRPAHTVVAVPQDLDTLLVVFLSQRHTHVCRGRQAAVHSDRQTNRLTRALRSTLSISHSLECGEHTHTHLHTHTHTYTHPYVYIYIHTHTHIYIWVCVCACMCVGVCVCVCVCVRRTPKSESCLLYTSPSPRDRGISSMPSSA